MDADDCGDPACFCHGETHNCPGMPAPTRLGDEWRCEEKGCAWVTRELAGMPFAESLVVRGLAKADALVWVTLP